MLSPNTLAPPLLFTFLVFSTALSQDPLILPPYEGPKECPYTPDTLGYTNTTILHNDMVHEALNLTEIQSEYRYVLCPETTFDLGTVVDDKFLQVVTPLLPVLSNTTFYCGSDGAVQNNCILKGGYRHVLYLDQFLLSGIVFRGLTFTESSDAAIMAVGNSYSTALFVDCVFQANMGQVVVYISYDGVPGRRLRNQPEFREYQLPFDESVYAMIPSSEPQDASWLSYSEVLPEHLVEELGIVPSVENSIYAAEEYSYRHEGRGLQGGPMSMPVYFLGCTFQDNLESIGVFLNIGGMVQIINSAIEDNQSSQLATVTVLFGGALVMTGNTHFQSNYDKIGPVFIDKYSHLILNEEVTGLTNLGGNKGECDILMEDFNSDCLNATANSCIGTCCSFGDTSCDYITEEPTSPPTDEEVVSESSDEGGQTIIVSFGPKSKDSKDESNSTEAPVNEDLLQQALAESDSVAKCIATGTIVYLVVMAIMVL